MTKRDQRGDCRSDPLQQSISSIQEDFDLFHCSEESLKLFELSDMADEVLKVIKEMENFREDYCKTFPHNGGAHFTIVKSAMSTLKEIYTQARIAYLMEFQKWLADMELEQEAKNESESNTP